MMKRIWNNSCTLFGNSLKQSEIKHCISSLHVYFVSKYLCKGNKHGHLLWKSYYMIHDSRYTLRSCISNYACLPHTRWTKSTLPPQYILKTRSFRKPLLWTQILNHPRSNLTYWGSIWQKKNPSASPMTSEGYLQPLQKNL